MARDRESKGFRLPAGVAEKQRIEALEAKVKDLEARIQRLESSNSAGNEPNTAAKDALVVRAAELKIDAPSVLKRWGEDKLKAAIDKAEAEAKDAIDATAGAQE